MAIQYVTVKEAPLHNNCPECFNNQGLHLTFKQKFIETKFYKSLTTETTQEIACKVCDSIIYPVMWTDDIERVFNYQKRAFIPKKSSFKLKQVSWILIIALIAIIVIGIVTTLLL